MHLHVFNIDLYIYIYILWTQTDLLPLIKNKNQMDSLKINVRAQANVVKLDLGSYTSHVTVQHINPLLCLRRELVYTS